MSTVVAAGRRYLPRGWADLGRQLAIWFGFAVLYQLARGLADRNPERAFANGYRVLDFETEVGHRLYELWVYLRRHDAFVGFRNSILLANTIGLLGYVVMPTAPPRLLGVGFVDQHRDGLVQLAANPYAAMPSLHAGDALIVGVVLFSVCRSWWAKAFWAAWPFWVWFSVMATGNHFWLDCVAGIAVALFAMAIVYRRSIRGVFAAHPA